MTLRHFQIFVGVCDTMNMSAAAESLFLSQSAVSQAVAELEKYYGIRLFERLSRKLYLTQAGEKLLSYARHMLRMNLEIESDMKALRESGSIRVGASVTVGATVLPKLASGFQSSHPGIRIEVVEDNTEHVEKLILGDRLDLGLVEGDIVSREILSHPFLQDELTLICGAHHRFAGLETVDPRMLEREPFIIREKGSGTRKTFEGVMAANGLSWQAAWTCNNADTIKMAVAEGLGISVISRRAVASETASGLLHSFAAGGIRFERAFQIVYHKNKFLTEPMKQFIDLCARQGQAADGSAAGDAVRF